MDPNRTILVTGAAGFIGSYIVGYLNENGFENIIIADEFPARLAGGDDKSKNSNYETKKIRAKVDRNDLFNWLNNNQKFDFVIHLGARTDTTEFDYSILEALNVNYSKKIWNYCVEKNIPLIYASSAATYGAGELGYRDDHHLPEKLDPLNPYGRSKNEFDKWVLRQDHYPPFWAGLKFFNVYGPNEYHKERMASVIFHSYNQIMKTGRVKLFRSHKPDFKDGEQLRDFIYVKDVAKICLWLMNKNSEQVNSVSSGLYNAGTGKARTFIDLVTSIFISLGKEPVIEFIDTPEDIRDKYQYFTQADMSKILQAGFKEKFYSLEDGIDDYVKQFLLNKSYF